MPHLLTIDEVKLWCRIDDADDPAEQAQIDAQILMLIGAAKRYLKRATGIDFTSEDEEAKVCALALIAENWENRKAATEKYMKTNPFIQSMITQLTYGVNKPNGGDSHGCRTSST